MIPEMISHYRVICKLGQGGMGEVYLAEDTKLHRKVAIKSLQAKLLMDKKAQRRLAIEAQAAAQLDHPNICAIHEQLEAGDRTFIIMQYVEGETLSERIRRGPLAPRESLDIAAQIADALAEVHSHGIVHRDIKPQNIIITPLGRVKVLDFGLAKIVRGESVSENAGVTSLWFTDFEAIVGTAPYMSPEQAMHAALDGRSDLFSLGTLLYECATGIPPFCGCCAAEICSNVIHLDPPPPSQFNRCVPPGLDRITLKALEKRVESRYQSAVELMSDLREMRDILQPEDPSSHHDLLRPTAAQSAIALTITDDSQQRPPAFLGAALRDVSWVMPALSRSPQSVTA